MDRAIDRPKTMARSERLLAILQSMRGRNGATTAAALASEMSVSQRTIYRDIAALVRRGAIVEGEAGIGYVIRAGHFLPALSLTGLEVDALMLGLRFVMRREDQALARAGASAASKLIDTLSTELAARARATPLVVGPASEEKSDRLASLRDAIERRRKVHVVYIADDGRRSDRVIWPVLIGLFNDADILAAWCETAGAFRHFRLDRIVLLEVFKTAVRRPHAGLLAEYNRLYRRVEDFDPVGAANVKRRYPTAAATVWAR